LGPQVHLSKIFPAALVGTLTIVLMSLCISFWFVLMLPFILLRLLPIYRIQRLASKFCVQIATYWVGSNQFLYKFLHGSQEHIEINGQFKPNKSYLVISNHKAWADILILFNVLHQRAPFGRFFLKKELMWVPIVGLVCWAMDFPFMKRRGQIGRGRNPKQVIQDIEAARKACEVYKESPVSVINFLEGTRFTIEKKSKTQSSYNHLLAPKYGGLLACINAMGDQFEGLVNITIVYAPCKGNITWSWLCGRQTDMQIHVEILPIPIDKIAGNFRSDLEFKSHFKAWVADIWADKDRRLAQMKNKLNSFES
jgi:1-acyl-sn-glycerol-3-phosphate acyltransferase